MNRVRKFFSDRITRYTISKDKAPWFGIGPVWGSTDDYSVTGLSVSVGQRAIAIHRRVR